MKWIKASLIFPEDPNEKCFRRKVGGIYQYFQTEDFDSEFLTFNEEEIEYWAASLRIAGKKWGMILRRSLHTWALPRILKRVNGFR